MATHQGGKGIWGERGEIVRCGEKWGDMGRSGEVGGRKEGGAMDVAALSRPSPSRQTEKQHCISFVDFKAFLRMMMTVMVITMIMTKRTTKCERK